MFRRFTIRPPSAVLLLNATSPANFNKSSNLFPILQSASDCCCPVLVTETHNTSSSISFNSSTFNSPRFLGPVFLKPSLKRRSQNKKKEPASSSENIIMDFGKELAEIKLKFESLEASQREILHLLQQLDKNCSSPTNTNSSVSENEVSSFPPSSENEVSPTNTSSSSVEWMEEILSVTDDFDEYLKPETTEIPSDVVREFCKYLNDFEGDVALARDALLWISKFVLDAESAMKWTRCVVFIDNIEANQRIFGTEQVRDAFVAVAQFATSGGQFGAVSEYCSAVECLTKDNEFNQRLFGTTEVLKCFVSLSKFVKSSSSCYWYCKALRYITELKENQQIFGTEELRDSMLRVAKFVRDEEDRDAWLQLLDNLTDKNKSIRKLFSVDALKAEKERIKKIRKSY